MIKDNKNTTVAMNDKNGIFIQFDGESEGIAGKNLIESFENDATIIFNETYIIVGAHTKALKIHAMYDLTIIGNVTVKECVVNGSLTVIGDADIAILNCQNNFICQGGIRSDKMYVGGNVIVGSIDCNGLICDGNVILQTTANIKEDAKIGGTIVACEGIMGAGTFSAVNAIANEYFEFDGQYKGKIFELDTNTTIKDSLSVKSVSCETIEEMINHVNDRLADEYSRCADLDEEGVIQRLKVLGNIQNQSLRILPIAEPLFKSLTEMSYKDRIDTVDEYLIVLMAQKVLPKALFNYESIEHIGRLFLPKAQKEIGGLGFRPCTIERLSRVLSMAVRIVEDRPIDLEILMDKIFQSIGLKYSTVSSMIDRNDYRKSE